MRALVAVCLCFVLFHSPALFIFFFHFVFTFRRRSNYMSTVHGLVWLVCGERSGHNTSALVRIVRVLNSISFLSFGAFAPLREWF